MWMAQNQPHHTSEWILCMENEVSELVSGSFAWGRKYVIFVKDFGRHPQGAQPRINYSCQTGRVRKEEYRRLYQKLTVPWPVSVPFETHCHGTILPGI